MRLLYYTLILYCFATAAHAQNFELQDGDTINMTDASGKKQGKWILFGRHKPGHCYQPDQKAEEGSYTDNRKTGIWMEYYCNGNLKNRFTFVNGRADGFSQIYHENGKLSEEGVWKNSRWIGNYKLFYDNGQVQHEFVFNESGRRDGPQKYFHSNGQVAIEGTFENGKESGLIKEYHENGDLKAEKNYNSGEVDLASIREHAPQKAIPKKTEEPADNAPSVQLSKDEKPNEAVAPVSKGPIILNGEHTLYNSNKQITKSGLFKNNRFIQGKAYIYNENGILERIAVYKNGMYVGDAQAEN